MTIYEYLELLNDNHEMVFTLFDCNTESLVFMATENAENTCEFSKEDLLYSECSDYEIRSIDMWVKDNIIHVEFNVTVDED